MSGRTVTHREEERHIRNKRDKSKEKRPKGERRSKSRGRANRRIMYFWLIKSYIF